MATLINQSTYTQSTAQAETQFTLPLPHTTEGRYQVAVYNASTETELEVIVYVDSDGEQSEQRAESGRWNVYEYGVQNGVSRQVKGLGLYNATYWIKTVALSSFSTSFGVTVKVFDMG